MSEGRPLDIHFSSGEIVAIDLDNLDPEPGASIIELLREGQCHVKAWLRLAVEYWKIGLLGPATDIAVAAVDRESLLHHDYQGVMLNLLYITDFTQNGDETALPRVYSLLANLQLERARSAPKLIMADARECILSIS